MKVNYFIREFMNALNCIPDYGMKHPMFQKEKTADVGASNGRV